MIITIGVNKRVTAEPIFLPIEAAFLYIDCSFTILSIVGVLIASTRLVEVFCVNTASIL